MSDIQTLKEIAESSETSMNEAYGIYRSKTFDKFLFVEGLTDKKMLQNKGYDEEQYYYLGMLGKPLVLKSHEIFFENQYYKEIKKIAYIIDNDYDHITQTIITSKNLFIHSVCNETFVHYYNDLEGFLVNSDSLVRFLRELGLNKSEINKLKNDVELESRRIGKYRAANEYLKKKKSLSLTSTILFSFEIENFFDRKSFLFLEKDFESAVRGCSQYKNLVDELFQEAVNINLKFPNKWSLSRGHDISELISIYLFDKFDIDLNSEDIEQCLRLAIDSEDMKVYSVTNSLSNFFK
ncbi:hypothetical protein [Acinetobacter sp. WCHA39]|uniref:hypothetical protein n=1 Tax=Acinetobacter sp. WCHA39 TaxID=2004648 RepID=UPI000B3C0A46|nr:hypothetical protein [Acinetobacter sp. WCHA39]